MGVVTVVKQLICKNQLQAVPSTQFASSSGSFEEICPWSWLMLDESLLGLLARSTANHSPQALGVQSITCGAAMLATNLRGPGALPVRILVG